MEYMTSVTWSSEKERTPIVDHVEVLANALRSARKSAGVTQEQAADSIGLDRSMIAKIESGVRQVSAIEIQELAKCYRTTPNLLLETPDSSDALRKTYDHIDTVMRLLASAQIELMRRQFTHDRSKLASPEWEMFEKVTHKLRGMTYGSDEYKAQLAEMREGPLGHHYEHNRHHPEFFKNGIEGMNLFDILEMFIDWMAATKRHADGDIYKSIEINTERFGLSPQLVEIFKNTVPWIEDEFDGLYTQKDIAKIRGIIKDHGTNKG